MMTGVGVCGRLPVGIPLTIGQRGTVLRSGALSVVVSSVPLVSTMPAMPAMPEEVHQRTRQDYKKRQQLQ